MDRTEFAAIWAELCDFVVSREDQPLEETFDRLIKKILERPDLDALLVFHISRPRPSSGGEGLDRLIRGRPLRDLRWSELTRAGAESTVDGALYILARLRARKTGGST